MIRGEDGKRYGEASFKAEEKSGDKGRHICGRNGHFWKGCDFYNDNFTLEQNQKYFKMHHDKSDSTDQAKCTGGAKGSGGRRLERRVAELKSQSRPLGPRKVRRSRSRRD